MGRRCSSGVQLDRPEEQGPEAARRRIGVAVCSERLSLQQEGHMWWALRYIQL